MVLTLCLFLDAILSPLELPSSVADSTKIQTSAWPEDACEALRTVQEQLALQRAQLLELQKRVVDLTKQVSTPISQRKSFGIFSNPFRSPSASGFRVS